ncbi:MAG: DUF6090 family protein [Bacteroidota bacterium]
MLAFFRRIRKSLLTENKLTKYFFYALGEIILVVIGILIALKINNWNNNQISQQKELSYLQEIRDNLEQDTKRIDSVLAFNRDKVPIVKGMMQIFSDSLTNDERVELFNTYSTPFTWYEIFIPQKTAFNNMVAAETIDLVQDGELRKTLISYYEYDYAGSVQFRVRQMNRRIVDKAFPMFFTRENTKSLLGLSTELPTNNELTIHKEQWLLSELYGLIYILGLQDEGLIGFKQNIKELILLIDNTLENKT